MKRTLIVVITILAAALAAAAESRPLVPTPRIGGAGGPDFKITLLDGTVAMLGGGPEYVVVDGNLWLGLRGIFPVGAVPGITWRDVSGPTLAIDVCFGAY